MSDLGLGNLIELKRFLLTGALVSGTTYDVALTAIGKGVAAQFEKFCNRKFARVVGDTHIIYADRSYTVVPRYPIESISAIAQKSSESQGFVDLGSVASIVQGITHADGIVQFGTVLGSYLEQVRITYTGGYFWNTLEETDGAPTPLPAGATARPEDLKLAWFQQCTRVWQLKDKLGTGISEPPGGDVKFVSESLGSLQLIEQVQEILRGYRRFA